MGDYTKFLDDVASEIRNDSHDGVRFHFLSECLKRGILPELPDHWFDEGRSTPFPANWAASELTIFDNGEVPRPKKKTDRIRTTKTRFGGNWKAWTSSKVRNLRTAPWQHVASFFDPEMAQRVVRQLEADQCLDADTVTLVDEVCASSNVGAGCFVGLLRRQSPKVGTVWLRGHLVVLVVEGDVPTTAILVGGHANLHAALEGVDAAGKPLFETAVAQARLARNDAFDRWHNQSKLY
jgi:hypothetical protein